MILIFITSQVKETDPEIHTCTFMELIIVCDYVYQCPVIHHLPSSPSSSNHHPVYPIFAKIFLVIIPSSSMMNSTFMINHQ